MCTFNKNNAIKNVLTVLLTEEIILSNFFFHYTGYKIKIKKRVDDCVKQTENGNGAAVSKHRVIHSKISIRRMAYVRSKMAGQEF